jgi:Ca-activated chloride channel homolog
VTGRHRNPRRRFGIGFLAGVVVLAAAIAVGWGGYRFVNRASSCTGGVNLNVAAAPEIASSVQAMAADWTAHRSGTCVKVFVTPTDPGDVAAALAAKKNSVITGLGQPNGKGQVPDVWIADSST